MFTLSLAALLLPSLAHRNVHTHTQINGARISKGQSRILRDGNEIAFGSPMQQQNSLEDYRYIYRHLAPFELTGIHAHYDMAHELGRGTFATVMKAMSRTTAEWWAVKIIHSQKLRGANAAAINNNDNNNNNNAAGRQNSGHLQNLGREISILEKLNHPNICRLRETFVPEDGGHDFCEFYSLFVSIFFFEKNLNWVLFVDLVLELVEGGDLLDFILSRNGLSEPMSQHITSQICSALSVRKPQPSYGILGSILMLLDTHTRIQYIHEKGITHRDLKPEVRVPESKLLPAPSDTESIHRTSFSQGTIHPSSRLRTLVSPKSLIVSQCSG